MSEAEHISEILPGVMADVDVRVKRRAEREQARDHHARVLTAVADFNQNRRANRRSHRNSVKNRQRSLFRT